MANPHFDLALAPLDYALSRNPMGFPQVPGYPNIHLARTKLRITPGEIIPGYSLWVRVEEKTRSVHKLHVEISAPDDLELWDDDESPF